MRRISGGACTSEVAGPAGIEGRTAWRAANMATPAAINLPNVFIDSPFRALETGALNYRISSHTPNRAK
jgi:hypothetical protein